MKRDAINLGEEKISRLFQIYLFPTLMGMLSLCAVTAFDGIFKVLKKLYRLLCLLFYVVWFFLFLLFY